MIKDRQSRPLEELILTRSRGGHIHVQFYHFAGGARPHLGATDTVWSPTVDCYDTRETVVLEVNLAGIDASEVSIRFFWKAVQLSGTRRDSGGDETRCYHVMEIERGKFVRTVDLPAPVDSKKASAKFEGGMLILTMPRISGSPYAGCSTAGNIQDFDDSE